MVAGPETSLISAIRRDWNRPTARDWADVLSRVPLFASVGKRQLRKIAELAQFRVFEPRDVVVQTGDPPDGFYLILAGQAKVAGRPRARALRAGDYFGEMALLDGEPRSATITAVGELQTMRLPRAPFMRLLKHEPQIAVAMLVELAQRVRRAEKPTVA